MATVQLTSTDAQTPQTPTEPETPNNAISDGVSQSSSHRVSPSRSRPSTAASSSTQTTGQPAPIDTGAPSSSIHHGANLILDLIRGERKQMFEDAQRQIIHLQQQHNERHAAYSQESTKRRDAENMISHLSNERDRYLKEVTDIQNIALQARTDAIAARSEASEAVKVADDTRSHLIAVQDALQQVGITVIQGDTETPDKLKVILGTPWLELIPPETHSPDTPIQDTTASDDTHNSSFPTQHLTSPSNFINHLIETLHKTQDSCKILDSQRNQFQSDLRTMDLGRAELESVKRELEEHANKLSKRESRVTELESEIHSLKKEREDAVIAQRFQDRVDAIAEKDRQALKSSVEAKTEQIRNLQSQLAQSMATLDDWKGRYDAVAKDLNSQQQFHVAELQKSKEYVMKEQCMHAMVADWVHLEQSQPE
jgi:chromosome segregation ATPase